MDKFMCLSQDDLACFAKITGLFSLLDQRGKVCFPISCTASMSSCWLKSWLNSYLFPQMPTCVSWLHLAAVLCLCEFQAGSEQVSSKSGAESGLLLPAHLLSICAHLEQLLKDLQELQSSQVVLVLIVVTPAILDISIDLPLSPDLLPANIPLPVLFLPARPAACITSLSLQLWTPPGCIESARWATDSLSRNITGSIQLLLLLLEFISGLDSLWTQFIDHKSTVSSFHIPVSTLLLGPLLCV